MISKSPWEIQLLRHFHIYHLDIQAPLLDPNIDIMAVSDGAHKDEKGAFGLTVDYDNQDDLYQIEQFIFAYTVQLTTLRCSEAYGMMANIRVFGYLVSTCNIISSLSINRCVNIYSNNLSLKKFLYGQRSPANAR